MDESYITAGYHVLPAIYSVINQSTYLSAVCFTINQPSYQLCASRSINLPTSCVERERADSEKWMWEKGFFGMLQMACRTYQAYHLPSVLFSCLSFISRTCSN